MATRQVVLFSLYWALCVPPYLTVLFLFYWRRNVQPIKARSPWLLLCSAFSGFVLLTYMSSRNLYDQSIPCPTTYYIGVCSFVGYIVPYLLRCYRLLGIFDLSVAKATMAPSETSPSVQRITHTTVVVPLSPMRPESSGEFQDIIKRRADYTEPRLLKILLIAMAALVVTLAIIHGSLSTTHLKTGTLECHDTEGSVILAIIVLIMALVMVFGFLTYKMRHVTDIFSINNELKTVCVVAFVHVAISLWLQSSSLSWPNEPFVGYVTASLVIFCIGISVLWPLIQSFAFFRMRKDESEFKLPATLPERSMTGSFVQEQFETFLKDPVAHKWFQEFLINEFSVENILFWSEVQSFKDLTNQEEINTVSAKIFEKYIVEGAPFQVNVSHECVLHTRAALSGHVLTNAFAEPEEEIIQAMKADSYPRFRHTSLYTDMMQELTQKNLDLSVATAAQLI